MPNIMVQASCVGEGLKGLLKEGGTKEIDQATKKTVDYRPSGH